ncbi:MAG: cytochrome C oxidase subunit IV family protein [Deltaproteobacteria bacterium]|jgi:cytochrome c oxidase subunit 4|nr:cytochrome C oxidase subunit IV family protein [Deltaproteobacteria bacterium]
MSTHDDHAAGHIASPKLYFAIFGALMVGTAITVAAAFHDFGTLGLPIAMAIAVVKASLVVWFFMHVKYGFPLVKAMMPMAIAFLIVLLGFTLMDYVGRGFPLQ